MSERRANLLTAAGLLALLGVVSVTAPRWARFLTRPLPAAADDLEGAVETPAPRAAETPGEREAEKHIQVKLFFQSPDRTGLVMEERPVALSGDLARQLRSVLEELIKGPGAELLPTVSPSTKVLEVFVTAQGIAYVDVSKDLTEGQPLGSEAELITVYSIVNSLTTSFPAVRRVQILIDDRPSPSLGGHVDLSRPLVPDMTYLAAAAVEPTSVAP